MYDDECASAIEIEADSRDFQVNRMDKLLHFCGVGYRMYVLID